MFNITIEDGGAATTGKTIGAVGKAGVGVGVDVRVDSRWRLIGGGKLTLKTRCLPFMLMEQGFIVWASCAFDAVYKRNLAVYQNR